MNFTVRNICGQYQEMKVDAIESGTLGKRESIELAQSLLMAAEDLLYGAEMRVASDVCGTLVEDLSEHITLNKGDL
jgi:hypothetical protein